MKTNDLQNVENFNLVLTNENIEIFSKFYIIINEFLIHFINSYDITNKNIQKCMENGIICLTHIFKIILLYTKNLDLTIYHCNRALYFYVEFMDQVNNENHSFLQLSYVDAVLFVYKKTIFEINCDYRTNFIDNNNSIKLQLIEEYTTLYNTIIINLINNCEINLILKYLSNDIENIIRLLIKITKKKNNENELLKFIKLINNYLFNNNKQLINFKELEKKIKALRK
jgi:hypothetical protein